MVRLPQEHMEEGIELGNTPQVQGRRCVCSMIGSSVATLLMGVSSFSWAEPPHTYKGAYQG